MKRKYSNEVEVPRSAWVNVYNYLLPLYKSNNRSTFREKSSCWFSPPVTPCLIQQRFTIQILLDFIWRGVCRSTRHISWFHLTNTGRIKPAFKVDPDTFLIDQAEAVEQWRLPWMHFVTSVEYVTAFPDLVSGKQVSQKPNLTAVSFHGVAWGVRDLMTVT